LGTPSQKRFRRVDWGDIVEGPSIEGRSIYSQQGRDKGGGRFGNARDPFLPGKDASHGKGTNHTEKFESGGLPG